MAHCACLAALVAFALVPVGCGANEAGRESGVTVPWLQAEYLPGGRVLKIGYESDPCTRARRARVEEGKRAVIVTLLDPELDPEQACIALAKPGCVSVRLENPLRDRRVVDGARDRFPQRKRGAGQRPFSRFGLCRSVPVER